MRPKSLGLFTLTALVLAAGVGSLHSVSRAQPTGATHARATLVSSASSFKPGTPFTVAIVFDIEPTWHLYFKDPGDSGMPPEVQWSLPPGLKAGEMQFPKPDVLKTPAGVNFIYENKVAFLVEMTPDETFQLGRSVEIAAKLKWLECDADTCLPARQEVKLAVTPDERVHENQADQFKEWRQKVKDAESFDADAARKS